MPRAESCASYLSLKMRERDKGQCVLDEARQVESDKRGGDALLRARGHASEGRRRAKLDEALKLEVLEEDVLRLDPADGRRELVREELDEAARAQRASPRQHLLVDTETETAEAHMA